MQKYISNLQDRIRDAVILLIFFRTHTHALTITHHGGQMGRRERVGHALAVDLPRCGGGEGTENGAGAAAKARRRFTPTVVFGKMIGSARDCNHKRTV